MKTLLLTLVTLVGFHANAIVDMKNANYADTWVDLIAPGSGYDLQVRRTYNSRSLFNGIHGFGWCSEYESKLDITPEGNLKLTECGGGLEIEYTPTDYSHEAVKKTVTKIINAHKAANPGIKPKAILKFQLRIKEEPNVRNYYAKLYSIKVPIKTGTRFFANGREIEHFEFMGKKGYVRKMPDGTQQKYNTKGHLIYASDKNNNFLKFTYTSSGLLRTVVDNNGRQLSYNYYKENKKVKSITGPNGLLVVYKYDGDDVVSVKNAWKHAYTYAYDDLHNLTLIKFPDGSTKAMTYNKDKDWITSFTNRDKCVESYNYTPKGKGEEQKNHYLSTVKKVCGKETVLQASYEFWHKVRQDGLKYLARVKTVYGSEITDISYHPVFGRPTKVRKNNIDTLYDYFSNGLVKVKEVQTANGIERISYEYKNKHRKISKVVLTKFNNGGKVKGRSFTEFKYNKRGNLTNAATSDGKKISLKYDANGRISHIKDQSKKIVHIKYEDRFGKPAYVHRPGIGSIKIAYKGNGEIKSVKSKQGPTVAVQVANIFNGLLEVISPATEELTL